MFRNDTLSGRAADVYGAMVRALERGDKKHAWVQRKKSGGGGGARGDKGKKRKQRLM